MASFVLIHGAWHGGWCWQRVTPLLEAAGHRVWAPDLPGLGSDRTPLEQVTLDSWRDFVCDHLRRASEPVILVGHSRGGVVISTVAEAMPQKIARLAYLAAFLVPDGKTLGEMYGLLPPREEIGDIAIYEGAAATLNPVKIASLLYNTTAPQWQARAASLVCPEPVMSFVTPIHTTATRFGRVPRAYIECLRDNTIPIELQRKMQEALPCDPVLALDTDHSPFFSAPEQFHDALLRL